MRGADGVFSPVIGFLHKQSSTSVIYLSIQFTNNSHLEMSPKHRIFLSDGSDIPAEELVIGNVLASGQVVGDIKRVQHDSLFAPLTSCGIIQVNGVTASCYSELPHSIAHFVKIKSKSYLSNYQINRSTFFFEMKAKFD